MFYDDANKEEGMMDGGVSDTASEESSEKTSNE